MSELPKVQEAVQFLSSKFKNTTNTAVILGTGLGNLIEHVKIKESVAYSAIPHFPVSTVESHHGKLLLAEYEGKIVIIMQGRFHYYEGYSAKQIAFPIRVLKFLGCSNLLISNAAGGINPNFETGDLMLINDHINMLPNPLVGPNEEAFGPRFVDVFEAYDLSLRNKIIQISKELNYQLHQGVYCGLSGPSLETPAEYKWLTVIGADAVGMSTTPEVIAANHLGMRVLAISVITDLAYPSRLSPISISEIMSAAAKAEPKLSNLFLYILKLIGE